MKINFSNIQTFTTWKRSNKVDSIQSTTIALSKSDERPTETTETYPLQAYQNISFGMNNDMVFLLQQSKNLKCAYTGLPMLNPNEYKNICKKLLKRTNTRTSLNLIEQYKNYLLPVEKEVFELLKNSRHKNKSNFQEILKTWYPNSLKNLKDKYICTLYRSEKHINKLNTELWKKVNTIKEHTIKNLNHNQFSRDSALKALEKLKASGKDAIYLNEIYRCWYKLPCSLKDTDSFIVNYASKNHQEISKRLLSTSVATIEHIKPSQRKGKNSLSNYLLVNAGYNNFRRSMPLDHFIVLNTEFDIPSMLQNYIDTIINDINKNISPFTIKSWYPDMIKKAIYTETSKKFKIDTSNLHLTKAQKNENSCAKKLSKLYQVSFDKTF